MMFGIGETFCYFQCAECKCLQIVEIPSNMTHYYPENYYSFQQKIHANRVVRFALKLRDQYAFSGRGRIGQFIHARYPKPALQSLRFLQLAPTSRILDVGCGAGTLLYSLRELGMQNLLGIDPFNAEDITYENGVRVLKRDIFDIQGTYDLVMFHHAIEHMAQPAETLVKTAALFKKKGLLLVADAYRVFLRLGILRRPLGTTRRTETLLSSFSQKHSDPHRARWVETVPCSLRFYGFPILGK